MPLQIIILRFPLKEAKKHILKQLKCKINIEISLAQSPSLYLTVNTIDICAHIEQQLVFVKHVQVAYSVRTIAFKNGLLKTTTTALKHLNTAQYFLTLSLIRCFCFPT